MSCCSTGIAVTKIVHVNAPAQTLWDVLTDVEAYPNFVEAIKSTTIQLPSKSLGSHEASSSKATTKKRILEGTNIYEERYETKQKYNGKKSKVLKMRRVVTKVVESPSTNEYSISFSSHFDDLYPTHVDWLCNTSTLSVMSSKTPVNSTTGESSSESTCCNLVGSLAVEVGGAGNASWSLLLPILSIACGKRQLKAHAERHFDEELRNYGAEAERRYQQQQQPS